LKNKLEVLVLQRNTCLLQLPLWENKTELRGVFRAEKLCPEQFRMKINPKRTHQRHRPEPKDNTFASTFNLASTKQQHITSIFNSAQ
jgi:hypothetical protein